MLSERFVLASLGYVKCVIHPDRAILFDADQEGVREFSFDLSQHISKQGTRCWLLNGPGLTNSAGEAWNEDTDPGFTLTVLERMLVLLCDMYERRVVGALDPRAVYHCPPDDSSD